MSSEKQSALLKILKATLTLPAQMTFYGAALAAIALVPGAQLPPTLAALASGAGVNALSRILERVARGESVTDDNIRQTVQQAIRDSVIEQHLTSDEFQRALADLLRQFDLVKYAIQKGELNLANTLAEQFTQYQGLMLELREQLTVVRTQLDTLATRDQSQTILDQLQTLAQRLDQTLPLLPREPIRLLRLFLASPSDVKDERARVERVVNELNQPGGFAEQYGVQIHLLRWEEAVSGMGNAESVLLEQMPVEQWDIFVGVLWTRVGSPTGNVDPHTGSPFESGTEEEFVRAYRAWQERGKPHLLFYRRTSAPPSLDEIDLEQLGKVKQFLARFLLGGDYPGLFTTYETPEAFERRVRQDLIKLIPRLVPRPKREHAALTPDIAQHIRTREFQTLINERTKEFVGRYFIFKAIDNLIASPDFPSGYIVISGEPGIGKTTLIAQLVKQRGYVHHFNIAASNIRHVRDFLTNVCAQIILRYNLEYRALPDRATADGGFLLKLLSEVAKPENRPVVVLIDAIDEVEDIGLPTGVNRLYLPQTLPEGVFFVVTTRPKADYRLLVDRRKDIYLDDQDPNNLADVTRYIQRFIQINADRMEQRIAQWNVSKEEFIAVITEKSEGNFMYLRYVLPDIRDGRLTAGNVDDIRLLPQGLHEYYKRHWRAMKTEDMEKFQKYYQPVVCILAVVREPVTIEQVSEWTGLLPLQVKWVVDEWREFLNVDTMSDGKQLYRLYHTSFQEFLRDEVGLGPYHKIIAEAALRKIQW
jgi:hypothetical protein